MPGRNARIFFFKKRGNFIFLLYIFTIFVYNVKDYANLQEMREDPMNIEFDVYKQKLNEVRPALDDLAKVAGMNPRYFCRFFRSITHQTPIEYVNMYRIEKAAQMLHSTRLPITDICMECGFNDSSNFIKVFRKYKGMTPKQYRKV